MIENILIWIGVFALGGIVFLLGIIAWFASYKILLERKWFLDSIFNAALDKSFKKCSVEQFESWVQRMRKRFKETKEE